VVKVKSLLSGLIALLFTSGSLLAAETRTIVADPTLSAGPIHRLLLGADYRDLWETPIEIWSRSKLRTFTNL